MVSRKWPSRGVAMVASLSSLALLAGCGSLSGGGNEDDQLVRVGTTSAPSGLDPAGAWDGSWELYRNIYQTLLQVPNSGSPEPDAARSCGFTDNASQVYRCTLKDGLKFSNGNALDAAAVKYSIDRIRKINAPTGPAQLLESLDRIETSGDRTVIFHLNTSNATFPLVLATPATSLVDPESYPAGELRKGLDVVGSGPYTLEAYEPNKRAELRKSGSYTGPAEVRNEKVELSYFAESAPLLRALKEGEVDLTYRGLTPDQVLEVDKGEAEYADGSTIKLSEAVGAESRFLVFNPDDESVADPAIREAIAQLIDRKALVRNVYKRTAEPLYSMVPGGITGHTNAFYDRFGEPSQRKARAILTQAGITEKVKFTLWYTTDRYGATTESEFEELQRQLNGSGLFEVKIEGRPWNEFQEEYQKGTYPVFGRGWFPDFPDADNYIGPFVGEQNALGIPYRDRKLTDDLLPRSRKESDRASAARILQDAQKILAEDSRLLPLWQGKIYLAAHEDLAGVEWAIDGSTIMRMWELHRKSSW